MKKKTTAILTGDIVGSRNIDAKTWIKHLKSILGKKGKSPIDWEIFRGDMFQLETEPEQSLKTAIEIKAKIKQIKNLDVRIAIGIGPAEFKTKSITQSNGTVYSNSGICFENLKKRRLAIQTSWPKFDDNWNLTLRLLSLTTDNWTPATAQIMEVAFQNPKLNQKGLSKKLKRSQSTISASLKRAGYDEISLLLSHFNEDLSNSIRKK